MKEITVKTAAAEIVGQMSPDDKASWDREDWREGISLALQGIWAGLDENELLDAIEEELEQDKYRFDDAYGSVYEYTDKAYVFIGSYLAFGINARMSEQQKIAKVEAWLNQLETPTML